MPLALLYVCYLMKSVNGAQFLNTTFICILSCCVCSDIAPLTNIYIYIVCLKQYVGQTVEECRYRWNSYNNNGRKYQEDGTFMQQHIFEHFYEEGHHSFLEDVSIALIDKTDPSKPSQRENYWRSTLKRMAPWGLNVEDCV